MLVGRARPLAAIFNGEMWQAPSQLAATINMTGPLVCLWYFMSTSSQLNYQFLPQVFYFFGNLVFTVILTLIIGTISEFPTQLLFRVLNRPKDFMQSEERQTLRETFIPERINNTTVLGRDSTNVDDSLIRYSQAATEAP